jgi:hypothetical protein
MASPTRRVLGELTPNARVVVPSPNSDLGKQSPTVQALKPSSPLKQVHTLSPAVRELAASVLGRKRSIYEVEGVENAAVPRKSLGSPKANAYGPEDDDNATMGELKAQESNFAAPDSV